MGRGPRAEFRGATYHVFSRGNRRERIFHEDGDYHAYIDNLREVSQELDASVLAYCLMPNHPHLCIQTNGAPLSVVMHRLNIRHARRFNRKNQVRGHLYEGRYKALLIDDAPYLLRLVRYIHRNPVRAQLVESNGEWPHSSYREYLFSESWLSRAPVLGHFKSAGEYEAFMGQETSQEDAELFSGPTRGFKFAGSVESIERVMDVIRQGSDKSPKLWIPLGCREVPEGADIENEAEKWLALKKRAERLSELRSAARCEPLRSTRRELAVFLRTRNYSLRSIGALLGREVAAVSRMIQRGLENPLL